MADDLPSSGALGPFLTGLARLCVAATLVVACSASVPATSSPSASALPLSTIAATPESATPHAGGTASPAPTPGVPSPSAEPSQSAADSAQATLIAGQYLDSLSNGRYFRAWQLLATDQQQAFGSLQQFRSERTAYYQSAGPRYKLSTPDRSAGMLALWLQADFAGTADRAWVVRVDHPKLAGNNAGFEILVVAPDLTGTWRIWVAR